MFKVSEKMRPLMAISPENLEAAVVNIRRTFEGVSTTLCTAPYLGRGEGSEEFGGAGLAFSALAGWLLLPPNLHAGEVRGFGLVWFGLVWAFGAAHSPAHTCHIWRLRHGAEVPLVGRPRQ